VPIYASAFLIGVVAGLRAVTPAAAVSWAARLGWLPLQGTPLALLGHAAAPYILTILAIAELINDKLPKTPSRKTLVPFAGRVATGALSGAALGAPREALFTGLILGGLGAVVGTLGGYESRQRLVKGTGGNDLPIALLEDLLAIALAFWIVS
jgi:uncharacterized membrane protein